MHIGIVVYIFNPSYRGGIASYIFGLLDGFAQLKNQDQITLFCSQKNYLFFYERYGLHPKFKVYNVDASVSFLGKILNNQYIRRFFTDYIAVLLQLPLLFKTIFIFFYRYLFFAIDASNCEVVYVPQPFPVYVKKPLISSIHDIQHVHFPEFFSWGQRMHRRIFFREIVRNSTILQASSSYMANDFCTYFELEKKQVAIIRDGVDPSFGKKIDESELKEVRKKFNVRNTFIFYPAQHWKHKNHKILIDALVLLKKRGIKLDVVLTGEVHKKFQYLYNYIENSSVNQQVHLLGNVTRDELVALYHLSELVVMPSLHESNSLVITEAMVAGCSIIASDIEPNMELRDDSIILFNKLNAVDLAEKIQKVLRNPVRKEKSSGKDHIFSDQFSWEKTALAYREKFKLLLKRP